MLYRRAVMELKCCNLFFSEEILFLQYAGGLLDAHFCYFLLFPFDICERNIAEEIHVNGNHWYKIAVLKLFRQ